MKKTLSQVLKGMQVKNWEVRENSNGARVVYVRYVEQTPVITTTVNEG